MPKLLFSTMGFFEIRDLMRSAKRPRRVEVVPNRRRRKADLRCFKVHRSTDEAHPAKPSWQDEHKLQPPLDKMLRDKKYCGTFHCFLRSEFSQENLEFWLACEDFRATASPDHLRQKAQEIFQEYIQPSACREVNVDHQVRERIRRSLENPDNGLFDEAQKQVYLLMERDSHPRFLLSNAYLSLKLKSKTLWYI